MSKGQDLYIRAKRLIPGGTQLLSKRPEQFLPDQWPSYYRRAKGIEVEDLDGKVYQDFSIMGVGACILGYADPDVDGAVKAAIDNGVMCSLNAPEEVELAELLCELHPWAQMVRYARGGGEAMSVAVRIARAVTKRDKVVICGYHGWADWYLAANLGATDALDGHLIPGLPPNGVPKALRGTTLAFHYNKIEELKSIVEANRDSIGAIVMEPQRGAEPAEGFLEAVRQIATDIGAVLIFDEITTGFRMTVGGIHRLLKVEPDIAVFAKSMANGYAMAAIIGTETVMQAAQDTFISSTNWTERIGPVAALATIEKYRRLNVSDKIQRIGLSVTQGWNDLAVEAGLPLHTSGLPSLCHFGIEHNNSAALTSLFVKLMLARGYLASDHFKPSFAHEESHVTEYLTAVKACFAEVVRAEEENNVIQLLGGPVARRGFYRLA